jgi:TetR/AcrR family transcriptional regulator, regulator of cefoperazone and chloramphenicol sensitivity
MTLQRSGNAAAHANVAGAAPTPTGPSASIAHKSPEDARQRLVEAGLRLFAQQGFSKTSTRELAEAANVNIASISYYFGDKAGLYRAVFLEPIGPTDDIARFSAKGLSLTQVLRGFYEGFLAPLRNGDVARLCMKLHFREMLEPTGLWEEEITHGIKPMHDALVAVLARQLHLKKSDLELHRLVVCLAGLGVHLHVGHDVIDEVAPGLNKGANAINQWLDRLVLFGGAMVQAEAARRGIDIEGVLE